jgi:hypothetical protein
MRLINHVHAKTPTDSAKKTTSVFNLPALEHAGKYDNAYNTNLPD